MPVATLTSKGLVTLPVSVRNALGLDLISQIAQHEECTAVVSFDRAAVRYAGMTAIDA
jgi:hypothetical protein